MKEIENWTCPWCRNMATIVLDSIIDARQCDCGAICLAAPQADFDEVTDEALSYFEVSTRPESCGYDAMLRDDIRRAGVEIRSAMKPFVQQNSPFGPPVYTWFKRHKPASTG